MKKIILMMMIVLFCSSGFAAEDELRFDVHDTLDLKIYCFDVNNNFCDSDSTCQITSFYPNSTEFFFNKSMSLSGNYFNYSQERATDIGFHSAIAYCQNGSGSTNYQTFDFYVGNYYTESQGNIISTILFIVFGLSVFFLIFSKFTDKVGLHLFFVILSFLFLIVTMLLSIVSIQNMLATERILQSTSVLLYAICLIFFAFMVLIMIKVTISAIDYMKKAKGLK